MLRTLEFHFALLEELYIEANSVKLAEEKVIFLFQS